MASVNVQKAPHGPSARLLARELREWRTRRRLIARRAAATLRVSTSRIHSIERSTNRSLIGEAELEALLKLYQVPGGDQDRLRELRAAAVAEYREFMQDYDLAVEVLAWAPGSVPLQLRTDLYTRAVLASVRRVRQIPPSQVKAEIRAAQEWQARLRGEEDMPPLTLTCVLDESVLQRRRGPTSAMAGQIAHLASLPGTDVRVLPLDADGPSFDPFTLLGFGDEMADVVLLDSPAGSTRIADDDEVTYKYRDAFGELLRSAADKAESAAIIKAAADRWA
jgi:hypothetical protein